MKRRGFLKALLAAPAVAVVGSAIPKATTVPMKMEEAESDEVRVYHGKRSPRPTIGREIKGGTRTGSIRVFPGTFPSDPIKTEVFDGKKWCPLNWGPYRFG